MNHQPDLAAPNASLVPRAHPQSDSTPLLRRCVAPSPLILPHGSPSNCNCVLTLSVATDGQGVMPALDEYLVLGLAHKYAAVVVSQDRNWPKIERISAF